MDQALAFADIAKTAARTKRQLSAVQQREMDMWHDWKRSGEDPEKLQPLLESYLRRVLGDLEPAGSVDLVQARRFEEGHVNETWYLALDVDGRLDHAVLKIFPDVKAALENARYSSDARAHGWPVPTEIVRDTTMPYSARPSLLMEYIVGGSLRTHVRELHRSTAGGPTPEQVAALYAEVAGVLGYVHAKHLRERLPIDRADRPALEAMADRCAREGWCDEQAVRRLRGFAEHLDQAPVTFCHGDLYESQVILGEGGRFKAFIDLDDAGYADPASDLGSLLGHVLLFNPAARERTWQVPAPTEAELRATARGILEAYRQRGGVEPADWPAFVRRARAYAWLRLGEVEVRYRGRERAKPLLEALGERRRELMATDPFETLGLP